MKVILLKDVRNVGQHNEIKEVADGYARNFLFPHKFACPATVEKVQEMEAKRAERDAQLHQEEEALANKVQMLDGKKVTIEARATEKGGLFKAIGASDITKAIRLAHSLEMPEHAIEIQEPIKTLGEHTVMLRSKGRTLPLVVEVKAAL